MVNVIRFHATLISIVVATSSQAELNQYQPDSEPDKVEPKHCIDPYNETETLCPLPVNERSQAFNTKPITIDAIQLDIRPENCQSFFDDYLHTRRGLRIESALNLSQHYERYSATVVNFPVVDFYSNGEIRVVKSRDLSSDSFVGDANKNGLYDQLIKDANSINEDFLKKFETETVITASSSNATTSLVKTDVRVITLDVIIQTGIASEIQIEQIKKAKQDMKDRWGFNLQVIEIP